MAALTDLGRRYVHASLTFGLELKVAFLMESLGLGAGGEERLRRPFFRLAQEPIAFSWWEALQKVPLEAEEMAAAASMLNGSQVDHREREICSHGAAGGLLYESPERAASWIDDIATSDRVDGDPAKQALYRFARIVMAHPFTDANGRFARAALQASLGRSGLIAGPCLALAPVFYLYAADIRQAIAGLNRGQSWNDYFERMGAVLAAAVQWATAEGRE
jgi:hypothetical protein